MIKLKLIKNNQKKFKLKNLYILNLNKINNSFNFGNYTSKIKLYNFIYYKIISYSKLGINISKQFSLISLYYLKKFLKKNLL